MFATDLPLRGLTLLVFRAVLEPCLCWIPFIYLGFKMALQGVLISSLHQLDFFEEATLSLVSSLNPSSLICCWVTLNRFLSSLASVSVLWRKGQQSVLLSKNNKMIPLADPWLWLISCCCCCLLLTAAVSFLQWLLTVLVPLGSTLTPLISTVIQPAPTLHSWVPQPQNSVRSSHPHLPNYSANS